VSAAPKRVVITGSSGDIGHAVARAFVATGASLGLVGGKNAAALEAQALELRALPQAPRVATATVDLLAPPATVGPRAHAACDALVKELGGCDALVALAGYPASPALWNRPFAQITAEDLHAVYAVDTVGAFLFAQGLAPALTAAKGTIVIMASSAAFHGDVWGLAYAPAKSANAGLVKVLARVLAPSVRVNGIAPGGIATAWLQSLDAAGRRHAEAQPLVKRLGTPEEVADAIVFLASPGYTNGQTLLMDGGVFPPAPPDKPAGGGAATS
jgi:3-oxoacyl-[acyl-carrier protein] reductase